MKLIRLFISFSLLNYYVLCHEFLFFPHRTDDKDMPGVLMHRIDKILLRRSAATKALHCTRQFFRRMVGTNILLNPTTTTSSSITTPRTKGWYDNPSGHGKYSDTNTWHKIKEKVDLGKGKDIGGTIKEKAENVARNAERKAKSTLEKIRDAVQHTRESFVRKEKDKLGNIWPGNGPSRVNMDGAVGQVEHKATSVMEKIRHAIEHGLLHQ